MGLLIDLGAGKNKRPGFIGIDKYDYGQEYIRDITKGLPFADNTVSEVNMNHILEHICIGNDINFLMSEIYRVCHNNAKIHIRVLPNSFFPDHVSHWNTEIFNEYCKSDEIKDYNIKENGNRGWNFDILKNEEFNNEISVELLVNKPNSILFHDKNPMVSIIIVNYNQKEYSLKTIESILRWTKDYPNYEIKFIDSGSTDDSINYIQNEISKRFNNGYQDKLSLIRQEENIGWVKGINLGLKCIHEESKFVILCNNDIQITQSGWLQRMLTHFSEDTGAVGPTSNYVMGRQAYIFNHNGIWEEPTHFLIGFFLMVRRSILEDINGLDEIYGIGGSDDLDLSIQIEEKGYTLKIARDIYIHHAGSKTLMPEYGPEGYKKLIEDKDKVLRDKWGDKRVDRIFEHPIKIMVAVPERGDYVHRLFCYTFAQLIKPYGVTIVDAPRGSVDESRNLLIEHSINMGCQKTLFIDDDTILKPNTLIDLMACNTPIVSALMFARKKPYEPCIYEWEFQKETEMIMGKSSLKYIKKGLKRVDATGFGTILLDNDIFINKLKFPWFNKGTYGEDVQFCMSCWENDIPIFCNTDLILQHIGDNEEVDENTFLNYIATHKIEGEYVKDKPIIQIHG
jgi:glycosyltransferase involved in cell wall biosynthesis/predicted SAM-dependent methyltransferase